VSKGRVWKYGDDVNTDVLYPGRYTYQQLEPAEMAKHALEDLDPSFAKNVKPGDVIVAGKNFGCGSSREQAAACLRFAGVQAVVAKSFSRIYFRNAINLGLAVLQSQDAPDALQTGDEVDVDFAAGTIESGGRVFRFFPLPPEVIGIVEAGGLIAYTKKRLSENALQGADPSRNFSHSR
jgi:3-isopropylmalate/(R)-2-methylmalate dehydratase small subunit